MLRVTPLRRSGAALLAAAILVSLIPLLPLIPAAPADAAVDWRPRMAAAIAYAEGRSGSVSFAVKDAHGRFSSYRGATTVPTASVLKVMFMAAYLRLGSVRDRALREGDRDLLRPMIIRSDDIAASRIADIVGPRRMYRLARRANMRDFSYTRPWGSSRTSPRDQARLMFRLRRYLPDRHEAYALGLLNRIVESQRWGIGNVSTSGWRKHFKGGWGSGSGAVDHQVVRLEGPGHNRIGVAVMTTSSPSHRYANRTLRGVFARLLDGLP